MAATGDGLLEFGLGFSLVLVGVGVQSCGCLVVRIVAVR